MSRWVAGLSITAAVAVGAGVASRWLLGYALGSEATWWLAGGVFIIVFLGGAVASGRTVRARRADGRSSRFVMDDTTGITIGGLSIEEYLARGEGHEAAEKRKQGGDGDTER